MKKRVVAIASAGGHWQQLQELRPAYEEHDVLYLVTLDGLAEQYGAKPAMTVPDCNRDEPLAALRSVISITAQTLRHRPHVIITTGALPGLIALLVGRLISAQTIWVDSVANGEKLSMSGHYAKRVAHHCYSQWEHVANELGVDFAGSVL